MKNINVKISDDVYRFLIDYKMEKGFKKMSDTFEDIVKEYQKLEEEDE